MEKKCNDCGYITEDENAVFCERCGGLLSTQNDSVQGVVWNADTSYQQTQERTENKAKILLNKADRRKKKLFVLAFVGLLFDFIFGIGAFLCLPAAICASVDAKRVYAERKKVTTWQLWAMVVGYLGALFGLAFFVLII